MIRRLEVEYRESARDDLTNIFRYTVESGGSPNAALRFVLRIEDRCQTSATHLVAVACATTSCRDCEPFRSSTPPS
ncbi:type II toxin-antitoxin system RelE/ParE family toxin [Mesorhizobium sp. B2-2-3]|uniref:type II toxin-antitoxin system RelE/ParE family toxin n=1 Tax=Mesorhizobium sp. B2-2-3 TaxID=2589963 RepID=UPI0032B2E2D3